MDSVLIEVLVICLMIVLNGFFACSEFAIISVRKSLISQLVDEGEERAVLIEELQKDPHRLLALVQIGVTVTAATASTMGGIIAVDYLRPLLQHIDIEIIRHAAEPVAVTVMVVFISYLLLVLGELAPKTIGLQYADVIALKVARTISLLSRAGTVVVSILTISSKAVISLLGIRSDREVFVTREEVQHIVSEGHDSGVFSESEHEYILNVFEFSHTFVREVMVPRTRIVGLDMSSTRDEVVALILEHMYSRYPVYRDTVEDVVGVVHGKDLLVRLVVGDTFDLNAIMLPPVFIPEGKKVNELLKEMQRSRNQMAFVVDEYGGLSGLVTTEDLIEELVGEIRDEHDVSELQHFQRMPDGSQIIDGLLSVFDFAEAIDVKIVDDVPYETVAGLILHELGRFPLRGESVVWNDYRLICEEVTQTSILKIRVIKLQPETQPSIKGH